MNKIIPNPQNLISRIVLGTVQFGLKYGINNITGIPTEDELVKLLIFANQMGIYTLDTAHNYADSEKRLGKLIEENELKFNIISKAPQGSNDKNILDYFGRSLRRLRTKNVYGYLLHDFNDYLNTPQIVKTLNNLKESNAVKKIGFSLYYPEQLEKLFFDNIVFDLIQVPYNIADRRFEKYFVELKEKKVEIHIRSVFLQGLFFMNSDELPSKLKSFKDLLQILNDLCNRFNRSIENIALNFVLQNGLINNVVLGIDNIKQLSKNLKESNKKLRDEEIKLIDLEIKKVKIPEKLLVPSNWN